MDNNYSKLRGVAFGGFNKQDVIAYIEKVKNEAYEEKSRAEKEVKALEKKVSEYEAQLEQAQAENEKLIKHIGELSVAADTNKSDTAVDEITEATNYLKNVAEELCQSLRDFMERISENSYSVVIEGSEEKVTEEFNADEFIAGLKAEIYSKLGVEESREDSVNVETENIEKVSDYKTDEKVNSILSSLSSFANTGDKAQAEENKDETVSNILGSLSFLK